jgi:hypothetical protein
MPNKRTRIEVWGYETGSITISWSSWRCRKMDDMHGEMALNILPYHHETSDHGTADISGKRLNQKL